MPLTYFCCLRFLFFLQLPVLLMRLNVILQLATFVEDIFQEDNGVFGSNFFIALFYDIMWVPTCCNAVQNVNFEIPRNGRQTFFFIFLFIHWEKMVFKSWTQKWRTSDSVTATAVNCNGSPSFSVAKLAWCLQTKLRPTSKSETKSCDSATTLVTTILSHNRLKRKIAFNSNGQNGRLKAATKNKETGTVLEARAVLYGCQQLWSECKIFVCDFEGSVCCVVAFAKWFSYVKAIDHSIILHGNENSWDGLSTCLPPIQI